MDNQTRNELKRQKHADDQAHIIRVRNAEIQALQAEKGRLQRALQERPLTPSEALIERAEKAEMESARAAEVAERWREAYDDLVSLRRADPYRPLTPDAITDELVGRARSAWLEFARTDGIPTPEVTREMLAAALTEPPARPEGAEEIEALIREHVKENPGTDDASIADYLTRCGVRVNVSPKENKS